MSHTPGPWAVNCDTEDRRMPYWVGPADGGELVAHMLESAGDWTVQKANARLIAAAPELLAALKEIVRSVELWARPDNMAGRIQSIAHDAITKAKGA